MPETLHLHATRPEDVERAAAILQAGGLVAFPTETVYGLGANALSAEAVERIFSAKQRPAWDPLIVHLEHFDRLAAVAMVEPAFEVRVAQLAEAFWPGPLTMLLPRAPVIPDAVTAGRMRVGVRVPAHPVARELLQKTGLPLAAPSANRFGHVSPTTAQHVLHDLAGRIDAVLDGGASSVGVESTVVDVGQTPMLIYRSGAVTVEALQQVTGVPAEVFRTEQESLGAPESLSSPGVGIRHYAPEARVVLCGPSAASLEFAVRTVVAANAGPVGVLLPRGWAPKGLENAEVEPWGDWDEAKELAAGLFAGLRALERRGVTIIICPLPEAGGLGDALRDRLQKAARPR